MSKEPNSRRQGGELFIVDNSDADWKVLRYWSSQASVDQRENAEEDDHATTD